MSKTKVELVNMAYKQLRISGLTTQPGPEEIQDALVMLEDMMTEFASRNICSSYVFEENPLPNTNSRLEPEFNHAVEINLSVRMANMFGLEPPATMTRQANQSLSNWSARSARINAMDYPNRMARGSGNTFRFTNFRRFNRVPTPAPISCDTFQIKIGEINNFRYSFIDYLNADETIVSFETIIDPGLELLNIAQTDGVFNLNVKASLSGARNVAGWKIIRLTITTSEGRVNPQILNFNVGLENA